MEISRLESQDRDLDHKLSLLRQSIKNKSNNVADLEKIIEESIKNNKHIAWYVYLLILVHFGLMIYGWSQNKGIVFTSNLFIHYWLIKKLYREIYMKLAMPLSIATLCITLLLY